MAAIDPINVNVTVSNASANTDPWTTTKTISVGNNHLAASFGGGGGAGGAGTFGAPYNQPIGGGNMMWPDPAVGTDVHWGDPCKLGHILDTESVYEEDASLLGHCMTCKVLMRFNRLPGGMPYFKAGKLIGEAMALDEDDNDGLSELLGDLKKLEQTIEKETEKLRRAQQLVTLSRSIVTKKAIADAQTGVAAD